jgi:hypothetical protein
MPTIVGFLKLCKNKNMLTVKAKIKTANIKSEPNELNFQYTRYKMALMISIKIAIL